MTKIIGIKELHTNIRQIRKEAKQGVHFIVVYRSKPVFKISPLEEDGFVDDLRDTELYNDDFLQAMQEAEDDLSSDNIIRYTSPDAFIKTLSCVENH